MSGAEETLKQTLRKEARRHRARIDPASENAEAAAEHFFNVIKPQTGQIIAAYWPKGREFDTGPILERLLAENLTCALPVVRENFLELSFARWDESIELKKGAFGIMEPEKHEWIEPDIVIVPLLAFDRRGYRLGQGGGYYDATLAALRAKKEITAVGLAYAQEAVLFNLPTGPHDQRLDWVITPKGTHYFG